MESKKLNKKLSSLFWFVLSSLPLIVYLVTLVGYLFVFKETGSLELFSEEYNILNLSASHVVTIFNEVTWVLVYDAINNVLALLGFDVIYVYFTFVIIVLTWYIQTSFIHVLVDFLLLVPRLIHNFMERWS